MENGKKTRNMGELSAGPGLAMACLFVLVRLSAGLLCFLADLWRDVLGCAGSGLHAQTDTNRHKHPIFRAYSDANRRKQPSRRRWFSGEFFWTGANRREPTQGRANRHEPTQGHASRHAPPQADANRFRRVRSLSRATRCGPRCVASLLRRGRGAIRGISRGLLRFDAGGTRSRLGLPRCVVRWKTCGEPVEPRCKGLKAAFSRTSFGRLSPATPEDIHRFSTAFPPGCKGYAGAT